MMLGYTCVSINEHDADAPDVTSPAPWQGALTRFYVPLLPKPPLREALAVRPAAEPTTLDAIIL